MARVSSLANPIDVAIDREISSKYDVIKKVSEVSTEISKLGEEGRLADVRKLAEVVEDIADVTEGARVFRTMEVQAKRASPDGEAKARLVDNVMEFEIPAGSTGVPGKNGLTPDMRLVYNEETGVFGYEVVGYLPLVQVQDDVPEEI